MNRLVPLFAIGVFVGFTLSQGGMVRHWLAERPQGWRWKAALNGFGALLTGVAAVVIAASKFTEGGWLIVITLPLMVLGMEWVNRAYARIGGKLEVGQVPTPPRPRKSLVVVPVHAVNRLTHDALAAALSLGDRVVAVHVTYPDDADERDSFVEQWERWHPDVELVLIHDAHRRLVQPLVTFLASVPETHVFVLIAEIEPEHAWQRFLQNQRGAVLARGVRKKTDAVVCRMRFRLSPASGGSSPGRRAGSSFARS